MQESWLILVAGSGASVAFFCAVLLLFRERPLPQSHFYLAAFLAVCGLNLLHPVLPLLFRSVDGFSGMRFAEPMEFLLAPLFWAYLKSLAGEPPFRWTTVGIHAIPVALATVLFLSPWARSWELEFGLPLVSLFTWAGLLVQILGYVLPILHRIHRYYQGLQEQFSNLSRVEPSWIRRLSGAFIGLYIVYLALLAILIHGPTILQMRDFLVPGLAVFVVVVGFRGLDQKQLLEKPSEVKTKDEKPPIPEKEVLRLQGLLDRSMEIDRVYLDPELSLSDLADRLGTQRNHLSYVINRQPGRNFYDFVNEFRVNEVQALMEDPSRDHQKILALAFDAGFNSKPTFNAVFKKMTGMTPSEYRGQVEKKRMPSFP